MSGLDPTLSYSSSKESGARPTGFSGVGNRSDLQTGVFLSSDGGVTFTKLTTETVNTRYVEFHSSDPDKIYVGIPQNGIFELEVE